MLQPTSIPEGMTKQEIDEMMVTEEVWRENADYVCTDCMQPSYCHPYTNKIWGCLNCGFSTYSVSVYFVPKQEVGNSASA